MPDNPKPRTRGKKSVPAFITTARRFYRPSFGSLSRREYLESQADWAELTEDEQTFTLAHLLYLNLVAHARGQHLLTQIRDLLDEVAADIEDALDERDDDDDEDWDGDQPEPGQPPPDAGDLLESEVVRALDELNVDSGTEAEADVSEASETETGEFADEEE